MFASVHIISLSTKNYNYTKSFLFALGIGGDRGRNFKGKLITSRDRTKTTEDCPCGKKIKLAFGCGSEWVFGWGRGQFGCRRECLAKGRWLWAKDALGNFMQNNETSQTVGSTSDLPTISRVQTRQYLAKNSREILSC